MNEKNPRIVSPPSQIYSCICPRLQRYWLGTLKGYVIFSWSTLDPESCRWPTPGPTPMDHRDAIIVDVGGSKAHSPNADLDAFILENRNLDKSSLIFSGNTWLVKKNLFVLLMDPYYCLARIRKISLIRIQGFQVLRIVSGSQVCSSLNILAGFRMYKRNNSPYTLHQIGTELNS